jgi:hypothetical protein
MEALMDLVAASLARNGIECPPSDFRVGVEGEPRPTHVGAEPALSLSKGAPTCLAEQSSEELPTEPGISGFTKLCPPLGSTRSHLTARPASHSRPSRSIRPAIPRASGPASRTTPIPPRPGGVAIATIVSSRFIAISQTLLVGNPLTFIEGV